MLPWAKCVRRLPTEKTEAFLTFDDGPDEECTPKVLEVLRRHEVTATFFVIANRAVQQRGLIDRILSEGHSIGNHSLDHNTLQYFSSLNRTKAWLQTSETVISEIIGGPTVGFRSPAGVRTPVLHIALAALDLRWLHWSMRFYDTALGFSAGRSAAGAKRLNSGDIVLLHDTHKGSRQVQFLKNLDYFIQQCHDRGMALSAIDGRHFECRR